MRSPSREFAFLPTLVARPVARRRSPSTAVEHARWGTLGVSLAILLVTAVGGPAGFLIGRALRHLLGLG